MNYRSLVISNHFLCKDLVHHPTDALPETNIAPQKWMGWNTTFLLRRPIFRGELLVSGSVANHFLTDVHQVLGINSMVFVHIGLSLQGEKPCYAATALTPKVPKSLRSQVAGAIKEQHGQME